MSERNVDSDSAAADDLEVEDEEIGEDPLLRSVRLLAARVEALGRVMVSRADVRRDRRQAVLGLLVVILIAQVISIATLVGGASTCFIRTTPPKNGSTLRTVCNLIPGYDDAVTKGLQQQRQFSGVLSGIPKNTQKNSSQDAEIARLKKQVARLERRP